MKSRKIDQSGDGVLLDVNGVSIWVSSDWYSGNAEATGVPKGVIIDAVKVTVPNAMADQLMDEMAKGSSVITINGVKIPVDSDWSRNAATAGRTLAPNDGFFPGKQVGLFGRTIISVPKAAITGKIG
jgi:hypothetical protein